MEFKSWAGQGGRDQDPRGLELGGGILDSSKSHVEPVKGQDAI
jgi:hypothetical protein